MLPRSLTHVDFAGLWESAQLVQLRGTYQKVGWFRQRKVILIRSEGTRGVTQVMPLEGANLALTTGFSPLSHGGGGLADLGESSIRGAGRRWARCRADQRCPRWDFLDRIAASELDPHPDLLRCLRGTPSSSERLVSIDLEAVTARAGPGRVPTEEERQARLRPVLLREETRIRAFQALEEGDNDLGTELVSEIEENMQKRRDQFGEWA